MNEIMATVAKAPAEAAAKVEGLTTTPNELTSGSSVTEVLPKTLSDGHFSTTVESPETLPLPEVENIGPVVDSASPLVPPDIRSDVSATDATVRQAIEDESKRARKSAYEQAMSSEYPVEAREQIKAQYERESNGEIRGGAYKDLPSIEGKEKHHMPSDYANEGFISRENGPALVMDKVDHFKTASWGNSKEAREFRDMEKKLIQNGQGERAVRICIDDVQDKFGSKYDEGIRQYLVDAQKKYGEIKNGKN